MIDTESRSGVGVWVMETEEINRVLEGHDRWLSGDGGQRANLRYADLRGANLSGADLSEVRLYGANLSEVDLSGADLSEADLREAGLVGANLRGADLYEVNLYGANLRYADLYGANLYGANLSECSGIKWASAGWSGHCDAGRTLLAVADQDGPGIDVYHCGCFRGTFNDLRAYIAKFEQKYGESLTRCADFVASCMERS